MGNIHAEIMRMALADTRQVTEEQVRQARENGLGNGFLVLNPEDGFRQDGSLWFGTCSVCGQRVTNSWRNGVWEHSVTVTESYHKNGSPLRQSTQTFDYCPTERGEV